MSEQPKPAMVDINQEASIKRDAIALAAVYTATGKIDESMAEQICTRATISWPHDVGNHLAGCNPDPAMMNYIEQLQSGRIHLKDPTGNAPGPKDAAFDQYIAAQTYPDMGPGSWVNSRISGLVNAACAGPRRPSRKISRTWLWRSASSA